MTTVYLDSVSPVITITDPANNSSFNTTRINVRGSFTESSLKQITVNGIPAFVTGTTWQALNVPLVLGANTITATAQDLAGNTGSASITVTQTANPVDPVQLQAAPIAGFASLPVTSRRRPAFRGMILQVVYDFDGDGLPDQTNADLTPITHTYSTAGEYFPVVTVVTSAGRFSSAGGWNATLSRLQINVQAAPVIATFLNITDPVDLKSMPGAYLYVLSRSTATITEFDAAGTTIRSVSGVGTTPNGLDVDNAGNVYVAASGDNQIKRYVPTSTSFQLDSSFNGSGFIGRADKTSGTAKGEFNAPFDVAVTPDGQEISVADSGNNRIQSFDGAGAFKWIWTARHE